jgi:hypothetical protein
MALWRAVETPLSFTAADRPSAVDARFEAQIAAAPMTIAPLPGWKCSRASSRCFRMRTMIASWALAGAALAKAALFCDSWVEVK